MVLSVESVEDSFVSSDEEFLKGRRLGAERRNLVLRFAIAVTYW
jgi:hypothetical protein